MTYYNPSVRFFAAVFLASVSLVLSSCGGGGGGGGGDEGNEDLAANVSLSVSPTTLDTGDRTTVEILIENFNEDGAAIKVRFPIGARYIIGTSELVFDDRTTDVAPTSNVSDDEEFSYLVYYFRKSTIGDERVTLRLKLLGVGVVEDGLVEVDADLDDPQIDNQSEFDVAAPNFAAQSSDGIVIAGEEE